MADQPILRVSNVSKKYSLEQSRSRSDALRDILSEMFGGHRARHSVEHHDVWALRDISLELKKGEGLGIIGHNGAGKSTLLKLLTGRFQPTSGSIETTARIGAISQLGIGFNAELTGRQNILVGATMLGFSHKHVLDLMDEIIAFSGVGEFIEQPIKTYSSGMKARLGYAISALVNPDILLIDEVLAVGDLSFKRKCTRHINDFRSKGGSILFVSHDLHAVQFVCDRVIVLERGRIVYEGNVFEGIKAYIHSMEEYQVETVGARAAVTETLSIEQATGNQADVIDHPEVERVEHGVSNNKIESTPPPPSMKPEAQSTIEVVKIEPTSVFEIVREAKQLSEERPLCITSVSIHPTSTHDLLTGTSVRIKIRYRSLIPLYPVSWGFSFCTTDGSVIISTAIIGHHGTEVTLPAGEAELSALVAEMPLLAGRYQLRAGIGDSRDGVAFDDVGWYDNPLFFDVKSPDDIYNSIHSIVGDLVAIKANFEEPRLLQQVQDRRSLVGP